MTDQELIKFLRTSTSAVFNKTTAHRIEELERRNAEMNLLYGEVKDGLEDKLTKAVEALQWIMDHRQVCFIPEPWDDMANAVLAELEGEDHG